MAEPIDIEPDVGSGSLPSICCAADRTYGAGAVAPGLSEDAPGAATTDPATYGIHWVDELYETARYHWRFPDSGFVQPSPFTEDLQGFYASIATQNCPASGLVRLADAVLAGSVLYANAATDPAIVYETYRPNDRAAVQIATRDLILNADRTRFTDPAWRCLFIGSAGSFNYGHWLVDDLPRLRAVMALMQHDDRPVRVVIHSYGDAIDSVRIDSIRTFLDSSIHIDLVDRSIPYHFVELYYATPVTRHPVQKSPVAIDFAVRQTLARIAVDAAPLTGPTLLFVDRAAQHGRTLSNHADVLRLVEQRGFTVVDPASLSFVEQVRLFSGAQVVIGQMGAAMTNTMFCRPSTTVIYLAPSGWIEPFYWDLAVVRGQYYRVLYGDVADPTVPAHRSDFSIVPAALQMALDAL
ncbi:glycosyltransferase family 61 protein [Sphingomonas sp. PAMC 26621]|uniref:glycosyltransferase family 61 protein n=1 Tax=Sphingomonas sp. PAMC 26621 TaxID=1112213 RepID=UPI0002FE450F|nr:glycosyltransferase 61 family protein [Sphingomonas sp. PAMC 26621]